MGLVRRIIAAILDADDDDKAGNPEILFVNRIEAIARQVALEVEEERWGPRQ